MEQKSLALDIGLKHTGVAESHDSLASPLTTIKTPTYEILLEEVLKLVEKYHPRTVVLGLPGHGIVSEWVKKLQEDLHNENVVTATVDETLSTRTAQKAMIEQGLSAVKRARKEHAVVAAGLLQEYLDSLDLGHA
jgi:putative transcription antitermination factor YqgF